MGMRVVVAVWIFSRRSINQLGVDLGTRRGTPRYDLREIEPLYSSGDATRVPILLETRNRAAWSDLETRARQLTAKSSGND